MKISETAQIVNYLAAIDNRNTSEQTVFAWHEVIGHLDFEPCRQACNMARADERINYIEPKHILAKVRELKEKQDLSERQQTAIEAEPAKRVGVPMPKCKHGKGLLFCDPCCHDAAVEAGLITGEYKPKKKLSRLLG